MRRSEAGNEGHIEAVSMWTAYAATVRVCSLDADFLLASASRNE